MRKLYSQKQMIKNLRSGMTVLCEGQFPIKVNHIREKIVSAKTHNDGSYSPEYTQIQYSPDGMGWYGLSETDVIQEKTNDS